MKNTDRVTISFGRYPFDAEPMQWYILRAQDGYYLLLSKYCIG